MLEVVGLNPQWKGGGKSKVGVLTGERLDTSDRISYIVVAHRSTGSTYIRMTTNTSVHKDSKRWWKVCAGTIRFTRNRPSGA